MKTVDFSLYIVSYNLVIGVLLVLASWKLGSMAGFLAGRLRTSVERYTQVALSALGCTIAVLSGVILVGFHILRIGVD